MKPDILLTNVPIYTHRPYVVGIGSLNEFLKMHGVSTACFDPVTEYLEEAGESYSNFHIQEFDENYGPDPARSY